MIDNPGIHIDPEGLVSLAKDLISIPSPTGSEADVIQFLKDKLSSEGFHTYLQEVEPDRPQLIATLKGAGGGRSLMFNGHLDNDSITSNWADRGWNPYEPRIENNRLWGAGIHNMKAGVAAMVMAAIALKRSGMHLRGDLVLACVVGELQGGKGTIQMLQSGVSADMAVVPEPYSVNTIITKCVGVHKCAISTIGRSIHTSRRHLGVDAIAKMETVMSKVRTLDIPSGDPDFPDLPLINIASIIGGRSRDYDLAGPSNLADYCTIIIDVRYGGDWTSNQIDDLFVEMLESIRLEDTSFQYEYHHPPPKRFNVGGADMPPTNVPSDTEIVAIVERCHSRITGRAIEQKGVVLPYSYCGNDTAHLEKAGIPCCLYGPRGYDDDVEMHVRIDEMHICASALAACAIEVCK